MDNSVSSIKASIKSDDVKLTTPIETATTDKVAAVSTDDTEYTDTRHVTVALVNNSSFYRKANLLALGKPKGTIGSSVASSRILSSNQKEVEKYFPTLVGVSPSNPEFVSRVKAYLNNIQLTISEDRSLDISFVYTHKSDYIKIKMQEDRINKEYDSIDRANIKMLRDGLRKKINALNLLESSKHQFGYPVNVEEYLMYRHLLNYKECAKDLVFINSDPDLRFYIKDEQKELERRNKQLREKKNAMGNYTSILSDSNKFNAIFVQVCVNERNSLSEYMLKTKEEKEALLMEFAINNAEKFNKICTDKNLSTKAFIELLIARGELVRSDFNQNISTADGTFIGANMNEAVAYFNNPANSDIKNSYETKLKLI